MQNSLCIRTFLTTTTAEMPSGSLGIVIASSDLSGRGNLREAGRSWAIGLPYRYSSPLLGEAEGEGGTNKAHLKSKMRLND